MERPLVMASRRISCLAPPSGATGRLQSGSALRIGVRRKPARGGVLASPAGAAMSPSWHQETAPTEGLRRRSSSLLLFARSFKSLLFAPVGVAVLEAGLEAGSKYERHDVS